MTNEALAQVERLERLIADSEAVSNSMNICVLPLGCGVLKSAYSQTLIPPKQRGNFSGRHLAPHEPCKAPDGGPWPSWPSAEAGGALMLFRSPSPALGPSAQCELHHMG
jgi:hypothetical protein